MPEVNFELKPVGVKYICDKCENGEMLSTGANRWDKPKPFEHRCDSCGHVESFSENYPTVKWINI